MIFYDKNFCVLGLSFDYFEECLGYLIEGYFQLFERSCLIYMVDCQLNLGILLSKVINIRGSE